MPPLRRHQLVHLTAAGWRQILAHEWDDEARACLDHWAGHGLPLVVTKQPAALGGMLDVRTVALGLPAPAVWNRRKLMLRVPPADIAWFGEFPLLAKLLPGLPPATRRPLQGLHAALSQHGLSAHAYGSAGWQALTGLRYLHAASDLDLWVGVETAEVADLAVQALQQHEPARPRLDGELVFPDGSAVAWREWAMWRSGGCAALLVKRLRGSSIERQPMLSGQQVLPLTSSTIGCAA